MLNARRVRIPVRAGRGGFRAGVTSGVVAVEAKFQIPVSKSAFEALDAETLEGVLRL
jgi:hypothetical protein